MYRRSRLLFLAMFVLALPTMVTSCAKKTEDTSSAPPPPAAGVAVTAVDLGRSVGSDNRVAEKTETFTPKDVVYATVITSGTSPSTVLKATWTYQDGQVVDTTERTIAPSGEAVTEFHIVKPDGLPPGKYKVDVFLDGNQVQSKEFEVKAG
jgi:hypothetical protein